MSKKRRNFWQENLAPLTEAYNKLRERLRQEPKPAVKLPFWTRKLWGLIPAWLIIFLLVAAATVGVISAASYLSNIFVITPTTPSQPIVITQVAGKEWNWNTGNVTFNVARMPSIDYPNLKLYMNITCLSAIQYFSTANISWVSYQIDNYLLVKMNATTTPRLVDTTSGAYSGRQVTATIVDSNMALTGTARVSFQITFHVQWLSAPPNTDFRLEWWLA